MSNRGTAALHISSAVVFAIPGRSAEVTRRLAALPGADVPYVHDSRIVVVLEAESSDAIGQRLAAIASMEGVISACLVFEQVEPLGDIIGAP